MQKVTKAHVLAVNKIMFATLAQYTAHCADMCKNPVYAGVQADCNDYIMYIGDMLHNANALATFNKDNDAAKLHDAIIRQDTLVRETFFDTLKYLEDNDLVSMRNCM